MKSNVGRGDRMVRLLLAAIVAGLYFGDSLTGAMGIALMIVAAVLALTGAIGFCPLYTLLDANTSRP